MDDFASRFVLWSSCLRDQIITVHQVTNRMWRTGNIVHLSWMSLDYKRFCLLPEKLIYPESSRTTIVLQKKWMMHLILWTPNQAVVRIRSCWLEAWFYRECCWSLNQCWCFPIIGLGGGVFKKWPVAEASRINPEEIKFVPIVRLQVIKRLVNAVVMLWLSRDFYVKMMW